MVRVFSRFPLLAGDIREVVVGCAILWMRLRKRLVRLLEELKAAALRKWLLLRDVYRNEGVRILVCIALIMLVLSGAAWEWVRSIWSWLL